MSNTSTDNFERIAQDTMDLLIGAMQALKSTDETDRLLSCLVISVAASDICERAIALTA